LDFPLYDVLIVGGGGAGLRAAIAAAETDPSLKILIVSKVYPMRSHTVSAEGGAAAALRPEDSWETHAFDTIKGSDYIADQFVVETFVREAPTEIIQLEHWGCPWSRDPDGKISARPFGGMTTWRTCFAADKTGFHMLHTLFQTTLKYDRIERLDESFVTSLVVEDGRCLGIITLNQRSGEMSLVRAKTVILSTGGNGRIYAFSTNGQICTGDGMALAYRAGVPLKDMEMVQFHPTGLPSTGILITEAVRGEGGYLTNNKGERFLKDYVPTRMELGPRDIISRAEITEFEKGNGFEGEYGPYMHLDVRHLGEATIDRKLPFMRELGLDYVGIDIVHDPIPVRPVEHYMMGGVDVDITGATIVSGLYACGEVANVGLNGGNRLGSNSLSECLVFGAAAGRAAARQALEAKAPTKSINSLLRDETRRIDSQYREATDGTEKLSEIRGEMGRSMDANVGVFRTAEGLQEQVKTIERLRERYSRLRIEDRSHVFNTELTAAVELDYMLELAEVMTESALNRKESRGAHARRDFPERDDEHYLANTMAVHVPGGKPKLSFRPVRITHWEPKARSY
jgi:fumarate reductase flavoprotein subunit